MGKVFLSLSSGKTVLSPQSWTGLLAFGQSQSLKSRLVKKWACRPNELDRGRTALIIIIFNSFFLFLTPPPPKFLKSKSLTLPKSSSQFTHPSRPSSDRDFHLWRRRLPLPLRSSSFHSLSLSLSRSSLSPSPIRLSLSPSPTGRSSLSPLSRPSVAVSLSCCQRLAFYWIQHNQI